MNGEIKQHHLVNNLAREINRHRGKWVKRWFKRKGSSDGPQQWVFFYPEHSDEAVELPSNATFCVISNQPMNTHAAARHRAHRPFKLKRKHTSPECWLSTDAWSSQYDLIIIRSHFTSQLCTGGRGGEKEEGGGTTSNQWLFCCGGVVDLNRGRAD